MAFPFEKLRVWNDSLDLIDKITATISHFPSEEKYALSSQMKRAADSIALNIAEGSTGQSKPEFNRFLGISLRSCIEVVGCLFLARRRNLITQETFDTLYQECDKLCKSIQSLRNSLGR